MDGAPDSVSRRVVRAGAHKAAFNIFKWGASAAAPANGPAANESQPPPQRDAARRISACFCAPLRSHPHKWGASEGGRGAPLGSDPGRRA